MIFDESFSSIDVVAPIIVCQENRKRYVANNNAHDRVAKYQIDGVVIHNCQEKRCDFLVENESTLNAYFIELKGTDIRHAYVQIKETICRFASEISGYTRHARVICARVATHNVNSSEYRALKGICPDVQSKTMFFEEDINKRNT